MAHSSADPLLWLQHDASPIRSLFFTASLPVCLGLDMEERTREMKLKMKKYKQGTGSDSRLEQDYHRVRRGRGIHSDTFYMCFGRFRDWSTCAYSKPLPAIWRQISIQWSVHVHMCARRTQREPDTVKTRSLAIEGRNVCGSIRVVTVKWLKMSAKRSCAFFRRSEATHIALLWHSDDEVGGSSGMSSQKQCISVLEDSQTQLSPLFC